MIRVSISVTAVTKQQRHLSEQSTPVHLASEVIADQAGNRFTLERGIYPEVVLARE